MTLSGECALSMFLVICQEDDVIYIDNDEHTVRPLNTAKAGLRSFVKNSRRTEKSIWKTYKFIKLTPMLKT